MDQVEKQFSSTNGGPGNKKPVPQTGTNSSSHNKLCCNKNPATLPDNELYDLCKKYGGNARLWTRKFAGLLPEVFKRRLYKKRGFVSIHEFAGKLAGMNNTTVDKILRLAEKLKNKPILLGYFEHGEYGWSKLEKVASITTPETDRLWAEKVSVLPARALEMYVREVRKEEDIKNDINTLQKSPPNDQIALGDAVVPNGTLNRLDFSHVREITERSHSVAAPQKTAITLRLDNETKAGLEQFKQKLERERKEPLEWNSVLKQLLTDSQEKDDLKKALKGEKIVKKIITEQLCSDCIKKETLDKEFELKQYNIRPGRGVPARVGGLIEVRYGNTCAFPGCNKPANIKHHTQRFALSKSHDPDFIVPLCEAHERIFHAGLIENEESGPSRWRVKDQPNRESVKFKIDKQVNMYRKEPMLQTAC